MENRLTRLCDGVIEWGILLLLPLIAIGQSLAGYTPILIKATALQIGSLAVFAAWLVKTIELRRVSLNTPPILIPAFCFMLSSLLSFLVITPSKDTSLDELLLRVPYFLIFFVTSVSFSNFDKVRKIFAMIIATGFFVALYGVLQRLGWDPFHVAFSFERISSFFGNPNFYVGFLTLATPAVASALDFSTPQARRTSSAAISAVLATSLLCYGAFQFSGSFALHVSAIVIGLTAIIGLCVRLDLRAKSAALITLFLLVMNIFLTGSRSGLIGLGTAAATFLVLTVIFAVEKKSLRRFGILFSVIAVVIAAVTAGVLHITTSDEGRKNTVSERKYYVIGAIELIKQKPLFGHGIGTFKNNYPLVKPRESWAYNAVCFEHVSNVYNEYLEVLHDEGILGFLIYVWLLGTILAMSILAIRVSKPSGNTNNLSPANKRVPVVQLFYNVSAPGMIIGLFSGVAGLLIVNIFSLAMRYPSTGFVFWLFLGLLTALISLVFSSSQSLPAPAIAKQVDNLAVSKPSFSLVNRLLQSTIITSVLVLMFFSFRFYRADIDLNDAIDHSKSAYVVLDTSGEVFHNVFIEGARYHSIPSEWEKALESYRKSLNENPFNLRARYFLGNAFNRRWNQNAVCDEAWGDRPGQPRTDAERALEQYHYIYRQAPHFSEIDYEMGDLYRKLSEIDNAIYYYSEYKKLMPFFTKIHYALADAYVAKKEWSNAAEAYKDALDLNQRFTFAYCELGVVYHKMGKEDLATEMFQKAREVSPDKFDRTMIDIWVKFGEPEQAEKLCQSRIAHDSSDTAAYSTLGWLAIGRHDWDRAIGAYEKVVSINPADAPALVNLSNLYYQVGKIEASKETLLKAVKVDSVFVRSMLNRSQTMDAK